ncbi:GNAT family N-acetyltransferase [Oenococcus oeni]|uniref:GNAT family N-acetyltransferase n=1 Tax=Oenococcus oeni TaxID=1247 RepID=UPI0029549313|nr:GNAT family N-acetyltransferase [Oenococcus oeni]MDV7687638.1 GNAT family N-acetyltransferase [Oenococcus oeni]
MVSKFCQLSVNDADVVTKLYIKVFSQYPWHEDNKYDDISNYIIHLLQMNTNRCYLYKDDNELVGVALGFVKPWYKGVEYQLDNFFISSDHQHQGFGSDFLKEIKRAMHKIGVENIILETNKDTPAEHFYFKNGFTSVTDPHSLSLVCETKK